MSTPDSLLQKIYSVFAPSPLQPGQQNLYVDLDDVRGNTGIVRRMGEKIRLADQPTCQVLTGHRGSGKSTELCRLRHALEEPVDDKPRFFVVQVQADDELDRNDIDFPEVLIALVRQVAEQLSERLNIKLQPGYFRNRWERLKKLMLSEVSFDNVDLAAGMATLSATIRNSPDARQKLRNELEPDTNNWLRAANDVLGVAVQELQKQGFSNLVVIVDDLDKMITRPHESAGCSTTEYLFVHRSTQLKAFNCHLVYTLPIELAYSHLESTIKQLYEGQLPVVPMTKIATPPPKSKAHPEGLKKFREMIAARLTSVGASERDLFQSDRVRDDLIKLTGGQPTELMTLIREAIVTDGLPIGPTGMKRCHTEAMRSYRRQLRSDHWPLLQEVRRTGQVVRTKENETAFRELLDSRAILLYVNDEEWYGVNPAIAGLAALHDGAPTQAAP
jgi:hypothetical protein